MPDCRKQPVRSARTRGQVSGKILLVDLGAHFGGVENYLVNLAELLCGEAGESPATARSAIHAGIGSNLADGARGEIEVYALCVLPELSKRLASRGVHVLLLPRFGGLAKPLRFLSALALLPFLLLRFRIQVVQVNGLLESILIVPARLLGRRAVYTRHGPFEVELYSWFRSPHKYLPRRIAQLLSRLASHVVCVSEAVAANVRPILPPDRYSVIPNWISAQPALPDPQPDLERTPSILCAARLEHYKGIHLLLEAARQLQQTGPPVQITILGDGAYRTTLEAVAATLPNVRFLGFQRDLHPFYASHDIFVMPSLGPEGLPMTSLEAMAHGLACLFSDLPVHAEITDQGRGAWLFRSGSSESLLAGLRALCANPAQRRAYAVEAHRIIATRYTDQSVRQAYLRVLAPPVHLPEVPAHA